MNWLEQTIKAVIVVLAIGVLYITVTDVVYKLQSVAVKMQIVK